MNNSLEIWGFLEVTPLPTFLLYSAFIDQSVSQNWQGPFITSSIVAILTTMIALFHKVRLNRLMIGINLYLIIGSIALMTNYVWLQQAYGTLKASGMLAIIILVGTVSLLVSSAGFIGVNSQDKKRVIKFCLYLLLATLIAFLLSFFLQGNKLYSEVIPFISLFTVHSFLKNKITQSFG